MQAKVEAQAKGLGVGYMPQYLADKQVALGKLIIKQVAEPKPDTMMYLAWRSQDKMMGKAQQWLVKRLEKTAFI
jgi:DNA-binding transcriptional LysR family regulator